MAQDFKDSRPFYRKHLVEEGKDKDVITIWLNPDERKMLEEAKRILEQEKDSTAFKQLALLGFKTIRSEETEYLLALVFANKRKNKRLGIPDFEA
jgi:hypothetical protein